MRLKTIFSLSKIPIYISRPKKINITYSSPQIYKRYKTVSSKESSVDKTQQAFSSFIAKAKVYSMRHKIELLENEASLCALLLEVNEFILDKTGVRLNLRFAGGWVRDKLLGLQSDDIDVAIDVMTGTEFVEYLIKFQKRNPTKFKLTGVGKIATNPDKSKHLETCTTELFNLSIDFVNLRSETYADSSRIPKVTFGTAESDALRRDATINALFYNLNTKEVEDFTNKGLLDLKSGIIRTPLPARETFLDDPLRILRLIRFANRFNFQIDCETLNAIKEESIKEALSKKISKERVGIELIKIIKADRQLPAFQLIYDTGIYKNIFHPNPPFPQDAQILSPIFAIRSAQLMDSFFNGRFKNLTDFFQRLSKFGYDLNQEARGVLMITSFLSPFKNIEYNEKKFKSTHALVYLGRETCKLTLAFSITMKDTYGISCHVDFLIKSGETNWNRSSLGKIMYGASTKFYPSLILWLNQYLIENSDPSEPNVNIDLLNGAVNSLNKLLDCIENLGLKDIHLLSHILTGDDIHNTLKIKASPVTGLLKAQVLMWQLENPEGSKQMAIEWLIKTYGTKEKLEQLKIKN